MSTRRTILGLAAMAALVLAAPVGAQPAYPLRPISLVVPFPAGGSTDLVARVVAEKMSQELGQQIVVDNRGGAGGNVGSAAAAKSDPDGYTLLMGTVATHALNPALYKKMPYDPVADFAPISLLVIVPNVLVVNPDFPAKDVAELIALLKAEPGKYSYASSGNGTPLHLSGELFKSMAGVDMVHVPYKGAGPGAGRRHGRPCADHVRQPPLLDRAHQGRQAARARRDDGRARRPRCPICQPSPSWACRATRPTPGTPCSRRPGLRRR